MKTAPAVLDGEAVESVVDVVFNGMLGFPESDVGLGTVCIKAMQKVGKPTLMDRVLGISSGEDLQLDVAHSLNCVTVIPSSFLNFIGRKCSNQPKTFKRLKTKQGMHVIQIWDVS